MTHASIPKEIREPRGVTDGLIRLSVGLEHFEDLESDIVQALSVSDEIAGSSATQYPAIHCHASMTKTAQIAAAGARFSDCLAQQLEE
jgi:hypothetical protein